MKRILYRIGRALITGVLVMLLLAFVNLLLSLIGWEFRIQLLTAGASAAFVSYMYETVISRNYVRRC